MKSLEASSGHPGLALYRAKSADLVITDIVMPEMEGLEMLLDLTRNFLNLKVIAISGGLEGEVRSTWPSCWVRARRFKSP